MHLLNISLRTYTFRRKYWTAGRGFLISLEIVEAGSRVFLEVNGIFIIQVALPPSLDQILDLGSKLRVRTTLIALSLHHISRVSALPSRTLFLFGGISFFHLPVEWRCSKHELYRFKRSILGFRVE